MTWLLLLLLACGDDDPGPCEQAWGELVALRDGLREVAGDEVEAPGEARFLAACRALPDDLRPCMSPRLALQRDDCDRRLEALDPTRRDALILDAPGGAR